MFSSFSLSVFAWESYEHGSDIHPLADPTKLELMHSEFKKNKDVFEGDQQQSILEKYGGEEHLDAPPKALLLAQTVNCHTDQSLLPTTCCFCVCRRSTWSILDWGMSCEAKRKKWPSRSTKRTWSSTTTPLCGGPTGVRATGATPAATHSLNCPTALERQEDLLSWYDLEV